MNNFVINTIQHSNRIPNLPSQLHKFLDLLTSDEIDFNQLAQGIERQQAITMRLLALANSAWMSPINPITSVTVACTRLGLTLVRSICIGLAVLSPFNVTACPAFDVKRYWIDSMIVGEVCLLLSKEMDDFQFGQTLHTAGILHNIGLLCLADIMPKETNEVLRQKNHDPDTSLRQIMSNDLHIEYYQVGALVINRWKLPPQLAEIIGNHGFFEYNGEYQDQTFLLKIARLMIRSYRSEFEDFNLEHEILGSGISLDQLRRIYAQLPGIFEQFSSLADELFPKSR